MLDRIGQGVPEQEMTAARRETSKERKPVSIFHFSRLTIFVLSFRVFRFKQVTS